MEAAALMQLGSASATTKPGELKIRIHYPDGTPLANGLVVARPLDEGRVSSSIVPSKVQVTGTTDAQGTVIIQLAPITYDYIVLAYPPGGGKPVIERLVRVAADGAILALDSTPYRRMH